MGIEPLDSLFTVMQSDAVLEIGIVVKPLVGR